MDGFFQLGSISDEVEIKELLLKRYSNIDYIMRMEVKEFLDFVILAKKNEQREMLREQWLTLFPYMATKQIKYMSFNDYFDQCTGANIDRRPADVIIAEIEEAHRRAKGEN